jgi:hypothetical protein
MRLIAAGLVMAPSIAMAAENIDVSRGADRIVFGNCVPSLEVENNSSEIIDYLQVDLALVLSSGEERVVELRSAYRQGVLHPIGVGGRITLQQQLDMSRPLGVPCTEVKSRRVVRTICEAEGGMPCASRVLVRP